MADNKFCNDLYLCLNNIRAYYNGVILLKITIKELFLKN